MSSYFGTADVNTGALNFSPSSFVDSTAIAVWATFTCPGSGNQNLDFLSCYTLGSISATVRVALYDSTGTTKLADVAIVFDGSSTTTFYNGTVSSVTLTGGTNYIIAVAWNASNFVDNFDIGGSASEANYKIIDYSAGFPSSLPSADGVTQYRGVRAKVTASGGGTTNGTLASTPTATCAFVGSSTALSTFASAPSATCAWIGASTFTGTLVSSPNATIAWTGLTLSIGVLASTPTATCLFIGPSLTSGTLVSGPSSSCSFTGKATFNGVFVSTPNVACIFVGAEVTDINTYLRRYLNDQVSMSVPGPAANLDTSTEDDDTSYIRRYLNDKV